MKKIFIIAMVFFLFLLAGIELYVQSDRFAAELRPYVVTPLQALLGKNARIGRVKANFIPMFIEARDISLPDASGREAAAARKIRIYINPVPLLIKRIRLHSISVLEPRIFAERSADGLLNLDPLIERIRSTSGGVQSTGASPYRVMLKTITVSQGRVEYRDRQAGTDVTFSGVQALTKVNLQGDTIALSVKKSDFRISASGFQNVSGELSGYGRYERGRIEIGSVDVISHDMKFSLTGTAGQSPERALNFTLKARSGPKTLGMLSRLFKQLRKENKSYIEANASIKGTVSNPILNGSIRLSDLSFQGMHLADAVLAVQYRDKQALLSGEQWKLARESKSITVDSLHAVLDYTERGVDVRELDIKAGDLTATLYGRADPRTGFNSVVTVISTGKGESLSLLAAVKLEGDVAVQGNLSGSFGTPLFDGMFSATRLRIRGIVFDDAGGKLFYRDKRIEVASADINQQNSRFFFNGSVDFKSKEPLFAGKLSAIDADVQSIVALFYRPLPLHFPATGYLSFQGTAREFNGNIQLKTGSGSAYGEAFSRGTINAVLTRERISFPHVQIQKGSGVVDGTGWIGFNGTYQASLESQGVALSEVNLLKGLPLDGKFDLSIKSSGSFSRPLVSASLNLDEFLINQVAVGGLVADLTIVDKVMTTRANLSDQRMVLSGRMALARPYVWNIDADCKGEGIDPFLLIGKKELTGRIQASVKGTVSLRGNIADPKSITGSGIFESLGFTMGDYRVENDGASVFGLQADRLTIASLNLKGQGTSITLSGKTGIGKDLDLSLLGTANLSLLRPLFRDFEHSDGTATVKLTVRDDWRNPDIAGEMLIEKGELKVKNVPQKFSGIAGKILFDKNRIIVESLRGMTGGGTLSGSGRARLEGLSLQDFSSKVAFDNIAVRYPEGLTAALSGDLYYDGDSSEQNFTGDILIKRARYDKRIEWKSMLVDIGKGLYQRKKTETGWAGDTQINIRFWGKDNIIFQNNLAKMPLDVDIVLRGTVNHPQLLGRIEARQGSVYFRQNEFRIIHGSADFVDPNRINPMLDIQAEIQIRDYLVRMAVNGTADRAVVTLLSDPSLPDSDILALLALGKTGTELKGKEAGVGMSEAASLATGRFQDLFESRARSLTGLDRFQVDPYITKEDTSVPRVTVGKEIVQDKLYVTYSSNVGSTTPEQIFRIEYILNKHFSVVGERNELGNTGADIKYRFEFK